MTRTLITVNTLTTQLRERGEVQLPANALITPAAQDWLRGTRVTVRRVDASASAAAPPVGPAIYFIGDAARPDIQTLLPALQRRHASLRFLPCNGHMAGLLAAVHETCTGLSACSQRRGIVLVSDGAPVSCVANRFANVRAAILPHPSALFKLQSELGVNLLILERDRISLAQMRASIDAFLSGKSSLRPEIENALNAVTAATPNSAAAPIPSPTAPAKTTTVIAAPSGTCGGC